MRKFRGLIALVISVVFGLVAARAVYWYLKRPKSRNEPVQVVAAKPPKPKTLSEMVPEGMRVVSVKVDNISGLAGKIKKGDRVDVLATSTIPKKEGASVTRTILQGVEVYEDGKDSVKSSKKLSHGDREWPVSLLVRPDQAAALIAASDSARICLMARNHKDDLRVENCSAAYSYDSGVEKTISSNSSISLNPKAGMRAVTLMAKDTDGVLGVLRPGDRVDVIVTSPYSKFATGGVTDPGAQGNVTEYRMVSRILLQNVEVLATEQVLDLSVGKDKPVKRVTLLVTPAQAEKLAVVSDATKKGIIRLVSRHPSDSEHATTQGQELSDILVGRRVYQHVDIYRGENRGYKNFFQEIEAK